MSDPSEIRARPASRSATPALPGRGRATMGRDVFLAVLDRTSTAPIRFSLGAAGERVVGGRGENRDPRFSIRVLAGDLFDNVLSFGNLGLGEAYIRGDFVMEHGSLEDFLTVLLESRVDQEIRRNARLAVRAAVVQARNRLRTRAEVIQHHYDLGVDLFECFLDTTMTYTCGYAESPDDDLEALQRNKLDRVCKKLRLGEGERLLDLGCGFGALLIHAAENYGARGVGVTISRDQHEWASAEIRRRGLTDRVEVQLRDYRTVVGTYDKVASVGLLEHVPPAEYRRFFEIVARSLRPSGVGLVHAIGTSRPGSRHDPFIQKYVFPNSHQIRLPAIVSAMERVGLAVLDVDNMIRHYSLTAQAWLDRFRANRGRLDPARYDERFCRMWDYWLSCGVAASRASDGALYQILFHNDRTAPIPLKRV